MSNQMDRNLENLVNIVDFSKEVFGGERSILDSEISQVRYRRFGQPSPCVEYKYNPTDNDVIAPKFNGGFMFAKRAINAYKQSLSKPGIQFKPEEELEAYVDYTKTREFGADKLYTVTGGIYKQANKKGSIMKPLVVRVPIPDDKDLRIIKTTFAEDAKKYTIIRTKNK